MAAADEDERAVGSDFLATAADNRISIAADPDRWEGLEDDDIDEIGKASHATTMTPTARSGQQTVRASGEAENESYRMFLTQRQQQQQQQQPEEDREEQFVEQLGSRLVRQPPSNSDRWASYDDEEDATERFRDSLDPSQRNSMVRKSSAPEADLHKSPTVAAAAAAAVETAAPTTSAAEARNFSVRKGGNQLSDLLPHQPAPPPLPPPPPPQPPALAPPAPAALQTKPAMKPAETPSLAKELHVGYLRLDSGHVLGPFRWTVDKIEAPTSMDEGLASSRADGTEYNLFLMLMDSASSRQARPSDSSSSRQRFLTRRGRLSFVDTRSGEEMQPNLGGDASPHTSLQALSRGLAALSGSGGSVDEELTRLLASALAANGASLMIASSNASEESASSTQEQRKRPSVHASVVAREPVKADEQRQELERLVKSLRAEVDSLKSENSGLRDRLKAESTAAAQPPSTASTTKPAGSSSQQQRPMSKGSYQSLYEMLQEYMQENESLRTENLGLVKSQGDRLHEHDQLARENRRLAERLQRMQRQQAAAAAAAAAEAARQKPLYVVSNPDSRASTNQHGRPPQPPPVAQQPQPAQQPASTSGSAVTSTTDSLLPPIPLDPSPTGQQQQRKRAFPTPPSQKVRQSPQSQQLSQPQQPMYYYAPSSDAQQNAAYGHYYAPVYYAPPQPPPVMMQPQLHQQHPPPAPVQTEHPLHVPKPGEVTYRGRFRQAAAGNGKPAPRGRGPAAGAAQNSPAQDVNKLNESLKSELRELDGAIQQHQRVNALQSDIRRSQGRKVLKTF